MREVASQDGSWVTDDVCDLTLDEEPAADAPGGKQVKATISAKVAEKLLQIAEEVRSGTFVLSLGAPTHVASSPQCFHYPL